MSRIDNTVGAFGMSAWNRAKRGLNLRRRWGRGAGSSTDTEQVDKAKVELHEKQPKAKKQNWFARQFNRMKNFGRGK